MKFLAVLSALLALNSFARAQLPQSTLPERVTSLEARVAALEKHLPQTTLPTADCCDDHHAVTYADAYAQSMREGKPLVAWVGGGDAVCAACVNTLKDEAVHLVTKTLPGVVPDGERALVVMVPENGTMLVPARITQWITGDATWGHTPSIRRALDSWRTRRAVTRGGWSMGLMSTAQYSGMGMSSGSMGSNFGGGMQMRSRGMRSMRGCSSCGG